MAKVSHIRWSISAESTSLSPKIWNIIHASVMVTVPLKAKAIISGYALHKAKLLVTNILVVWEL